MNQQHHLYWYCGAVVFLLFNFYTTTDSRVCETCVCTHAVTALVVNCQGKRLEGNNILRFDLLMFDEQPELGRLNLAENGMSVLPNDMFRNLPNLRALNLSHNLIEEISEEVFDHLESLAQLDLSLNSLTEFPDTILTKIPNLELLNLRQNHLSQLDPAVNLLVNLTWLDVSHNNLSSLANGSLNALTRLTHLDLSFNQLVSIGADNLMHMTQLDTLYVHHNQLTQLSVYELPASITDLNAGYNMITILPDTLINLITLDMEYNRIVELDGKALSFVQVENLNFSGNKLTDFPHVKLEKLDTLDLSYNQLSLVPDSVKSEYMPELSTLVISGNPIKDLKFSSPLRLDWLIARSLDLLENINDGAFSQLTPKFCLNLTISHNKRLAFIQENVFANLDLCSLDLSSNNLSSISPTIIKSQDDLEPQYAIDLQNNPFNCECSLQWMLADLIPKLYNIDPELLEDLRCASPPALKDIRMVHWYKWKEPVFCKDSQVLVPKANVEAAGVLSGGSGMIKIESSTGMLAVLIGAVVVLSMMVTIGIVLARRIAVQRSRRNRRFSP